jgi:hypothetical protein
MRETAGALTSIFFEEGSAAADKKARLIRGGLENCIGTVLGLKGWPSSGGRGGVAVGAAAEGARIVG